MTTGAALKFLPATRCRPAAFEKPNAFFALRALRKFVREPGATKIERRVFLDRQLSPQ
jgi:hypothetical protein